VTQVKRVDVKVDQALHLLNLLVQRQAAINDRWPVRPVAVCTCFYLYHLYHLCRFTCLRRPARVTGRTVRFATGLCSICLRNRFECFRFEKIGSLNRCLTETSVDSSDRKRRKPLTLFCSISFSGGLRLSRAPAWWSGFVGSTESLKVWAYVFGTP